MSSCVALTQKDRVCDMVNNATIAREFVSVEKPTHETIKEGVMTGPCHVEDMTGGPPKQDFILESLYNYYNVHPDAQMIVDIIIQNKKSPISLRLIDWFVTNYAKKTNVSYMLNGRYFMVHADYKLQLKAYSKKQLDPFCRRERIKGGFLFKTLDVRVDTTVGQLNFFRWAYNCGVLMYVLEHHEEIQTDINTSSVKTVYKKAAEIQPLNTDGSINTVDTTDTMDVVNSPPDVAVTSRTVAPVMTRGDNKAGHTRKKRQELSQAANKTLTRHDVSVTISFS